MQFQEIRTAVRTQLRGAPAHLIVTALLLAPTMGYCQSDPAGMSGVSSWITALVNWLIFTVGYPVGACLLAVEFWRWKSGRASLQQLLIFVVAIVGFFFAPNIVKSIMSMSGGSL